MKNIAFFCPQIYPCKTGGLEVFTYHLINNLFKEFNIILFTECKEKINSQIKVKYVNSKLFLFKYSLFSSISRLISLFYHLIKIKQKIDIFHIPHTNNATTYGLIFPVLKWIFKFEYIIVLHGGNTRRYKKTFLQKNFMRYAKEIIAVSEQNKFEYEKLIGRKIISIPSLIPFNKASKRKNELRLKYELPINSKVIIMVGSIKPLKGNTTVIKAFCNLGINYITKNNLNLVFAGTGPDLNTIEQEIKNTQFNNRIYFLGNIPNERLYEVYALADIYVIASWFESLSITLLEAMYNELPIIASNVSVLNSIITNNKDGLFFNVNSDSDMSIKLKLLLDDEVFAEKLGKNARRTYLERFSFQNVLDDYKKVYTSI
ncbi:MAG: glycosyltransferase family 4 protein [Bacteroidales bacterium]|nr:glycosyltransferase family 4 protein [Bacteroidales bacterium]